MSLTINQHSIDYQNIRISLHMAFDKRLFYKTLPAAIVINSVSIISLLVHHNFNINFLIQFRQIWSQFDQFDIRYTIECQGGGIHLFIFS